MVTTPIAVDAMGGDYAPREVVKGSLEAARKYGLQVILLGPEAAVRAEADRHGGLGPGVSVVDAPQVVAMDEHPVQAVRQKPRSSIAMGLSLLKNGKASAFISAGNSGAVMAATLFYLERLPGIERPAIPITIPTMAGHSLLLDAGANADCRPQHLVQFARMGAAYVERVLAIEEPRVALLSIGEEPTKGNALVLEAHQLLRSSGLNFIGNLEGKDIFRGVADVVVCDGFAGNVVLKTAEGTAEFIMQLLTNEASRSLRARLGAMLLRPAIRALRRRLDYAEYGAAPLLGINGLVFIAHGRSNARAVANAVKSASAAVAAGVVSTMAGAETIVKSGEAS